MIREFQFTLALPGAGKTTYLEKNFQNILNLYDDIGTGGEEEQNFYNWCDGYYNQFYQADKIYKYIKSIKSTTSISSLFNKVKKDAIIVSADDIKVYLEGYDSIHPENVHEKSVDIARMMVQSMAESEKDFGLVVMDGGGINNHYTSGIISHVKRYSPGCRIKCIYFDTPVDVCIERISQRERKVPIKAIYEKNQKLMKCIYKYKDMVDEFERINYYTNKYLLLDMDGTICGYTKARLDEEGNADFVNGELFLHLQPVQHVIDFVKEHYDMKNVFIVTAVANSIAWNEKNLWLDKYFPEIPTENRFFVGNKDYKYVFVKQFAEYKGWKSNEMVLIDDYHPTIEKCRKNNINCIHPSNIESLFDKYGTFN